MFGLTDATSVGGGTVTHLVAAMLHNTCVDIHNCHLWSLSVSWNTWHLVYPWLGPLQRGQFLVEVLAEAAAFLLWLLLSSFLWCLEDCY